MESQELSLRCSCGGTVTIKIPVNQATAAVECACSRLVLWSRQESDVAPAPPTLGISVADSVRSAVTREIASFAGGSVVAQIDYNDANGNVLRARVINNSDQAAHMEAQLSPPVNGFSVVAVDAPAHQTVAPNFPNNVVKLTQEVQDGVSVWTLVGVSLFCRWPA